jgi:hypothetical protein
MILGRGFESQLCLKLDGKDGPIDGRKTNENIKDGASHTKKIFFKESKLVFVSFYMD